MSALPFTGGLVRLIRSDARERSQSNLKMKAREGIMAKGNNSRRKETKKPKKDKK